MGIKNTNGSISEALGGSSNAPDEGGDLWEVESGSQETDLEKAIEVTALRIVIATNLETLKGDKRANEIRVDAIQAGLDPEKLALAIGDQTAIEAIAKQIAEVLVSPTDEGKIKAKELLDAAREEGRDTDKIKKAIKRLKGKK